MILSRLKSERQSLEALLRPPSIPAISPQPSQSSSHAHPTPIDPTLLSPSDASILESLNSNSIPPATISSRINTVTASLGPTIDAFADGIHKINQYRDAAERVAGRTLGICAEKLEERDKEGRRRAVGEPPRARESLGGVLRSLSRIER
jgi:kinetochore protein Mis13/DSN1